MRRRLGRDSASNDRQRAAGANLEEPGVLQAVADARRLMGEGRLDAALGLLHPAFDHESSPEAARGLAEVYVFRGNWDKAERYARAWISADPESDAARLFLVIVLAVLGRSSDAAHEAAVATSVHPGSPLGWAALSYAYLPSREPRKGIRVNVDHARWAAGRCAELDPDGLLTQAIYALIAVAANDRAPQFPSAGPDQNPSSLDAIRWLGTAEHSLGYDATALALYDVILDAEPHDQLALARAVQLAHANTTFAGLLVSNPWVIAVLPAQLGLGNLYQYLRGFGERQYLPQRIAATLRTAILWRRAHSARRPLLGAVLAAAAIYWIYRSQVEPNAGKAVGGGMLLCAAAWLLGSWIYARWRLRYRPGQQLVDLSPVLIDLLRQDTLPLKARTLAWPLAAAVLASFGVFFLFMGFTDDDLEDRPFGLLAGPVMLGVSLWVATRWLLLHWRLRHPTVGRSRR
jgi:Tetratricopeptide repeat